ncbi:organic cation transporter protein-like [Galendromus occidentalis]|uniref:Organic cation transporter protein-like n=1 Tax=Galendromus occidentalis TaxID=34638 RepID=A0AAJ6QP07_9ACAR|nr:organic cation transporter protein-like [Galendromus occidentalis]
MDFDEVLSRAGQLGRYQKWFLVLVCLPACFLASVNIFVHVFISDVPEHHCSPSLKDDRAMLLRQSLTHPEDFETALRVIFLPRDSRGTFSQCQQYGVDLNSVIDHVVKTHGYINLTILEEFVERNRWPSVQCLNGWVYDKDEYSETLASKFNAVCEQEWLVTTAQSAFFVGGVIGSLVFGCVSDNWGRRPALIFATALDVFGNLAALCLPNYLSYIILRFITGLTYPSVFSLAFVMASEISGTSERMTSSIICDLAYTFAMTLLPVVAYFARHWWTLQAWMTFPMLLLIGFYWALPESPHWLISQGRVDEAEKIIQRIAAVNGNPLAPNFLRENLQSVVIAHSAIYQQLCHGLSLAAPILPSATAVAFFVSSVFGFPGFFLVCISTRYLGRRSVMLGTLFLSGVLSAATAFVPEDLPWLAVLLPSLSRMIITISFTVIYVFAGELFPTVIRGFALGAASTGSQLTMIANPYILFLGNTYGKGVPFLILGVSAILGAPLMLILPETLNSPLPTTLQESEHYAEYVKRRNAGPDRAPKIEITDVRL